MNETETPVTNKVSILAILVLYRLAPDQSPAFTTLASAVRGLSLSRLTCIVFDNSPETHALPATPFPCEYRHDPANPGLAAAYQFALEQASRARIPWLLLLDQDTVVTSDYLAELLRAADVLEPSSNVAAIIPKLVQNGVVLSPHWPYGVPGASFSDQSGLLSENVSVYNSGALLRVEAVLASGGFPMDFPLDYLDHAMFARLHARGGSVFLLPVSLLHHLDSNAVDIGSDLKTSARLRGILSAELRFYRQYGSGRQRVLLWRRRLRLAAQMMSRLQFRSLAALIRLTLG